jgi:2-polyprenyl-3-methyl-5-hydroxy-6-metoxy-1,4-benzoquinol methylase
MNCPICSNQSTTTLLKFNDFPYFTVPLSKDTKNRLLKNNNIKRTELLEVKMCSSCCHCFLGTLPDDKTLSTLYADYSSYPSPLLNNFEPERDIKFLDIFNNNIEQYCKKNNLNSILEVACFDGYVLYHLQRSGFEVMGCDPSEGADIGKKFGVNIIRDFFDADNFIKQNQFFDIVISRHFLEHVVTPKKLINDFKKVLNPGGVLILEVPNVQFFIDRGLMDVFSLEHIQAFSAESISYLLSEADMDIVNINEINDNIIAVATIENKNKLKIKSTNIDINNYSNKLESNIKKINDICFSFYEQKKKISLWGAGSSGSTALSFYRIPVNFIDSIIDSDQQKWGMEYLSHSIPIISPKEAKEKNPDLIIITSMYSQTIQKTIKEMGIKSSLLTIYPTVFFERA